MKSFKTFLEAHDISAVLDSKGREVKMPKVKVGAVEPEKELPKEGEVWKHKAGRRVKINSISNKHVNWSAIDKNDKPEIFNQGVEDTHKQFLKNHSKIK